MIHRVVLACLILLPALGIAQVASPDEHLIGGNMQKAIADLERDMAAKPSDETRLALGLAHVLRGVERMSQSLYQHGIRTSDFTREMPMLRAAMPVGKNPDAKPISYEQLRAIVQAWIDDLAAAEKALAGIKDPAALKMPARVGLIRIDLDGDGRIDDERESFWRVFNAATGARLAEADARGFAVALDGGDVHWLRGYCHLLSAFAEVVLAHDFSELFHSTGHIFFERIETPHGWINNRVDRFEMGLGVDIMDVVAFVHMIRLPVKEPGRMAAALEHLQAVLRHSRESWKLILAETDDDREWIPSPKQKQSVLMGARVSDDMVKGWHTFLDEADALLAGKKLAPFWRNKDGKGINVRKVFTEPRQLDLVMWIQGAAATPYLEEGPLTEQRTWDQLVQVFGGDFLGYAFWFN